MFILAYKDSWYIISQLLDKYYTLGMNNLYNSTKLWRFTYAMKQNVMVHRIARPSLRGIPSIVKQAEVTKKNELVSMRYIVKVALLKDSEVCKDLLSISILNQSVTCRMLVNKRSGLKRIKSFGIQSKSAL